MLTVNFRKIGRILYTILVVLFHVTRMFVMLMIVGVGIIFASYRFSDEVWALILIISCLSYTDWIWYVYLHRYVTNR